MSTPQSCARRVHRQPLPYICVVMLVALVILDQKLLANIYILNKPTKCPKGAQTASTEYLYCASSDIIKICWLDIYFVKLVLGSNCPLYTLGAKMAPVSNWYRCQIVLQSFYVQMVNMQFLCCSKFKNIVLF